MAAQNFNFAHKFPQNGEEDFLIAQNLGWQLPRNQPCHNAIVPYLPHPYIIFTLNM